MPDFTIRKYREKVFITAETLKACLWLNSKIKLKRPDQKTIAIDVEHLEEFIDLFNEDEISYDEG